MNFIPITPFKNRLLTWKCSIKKAIYNALIGTHNYVVIGSPCFGTISMVFKECLYA